MMSFLFIYLVFFAGLRFYTGTDYHSYYRLFEVATPILDGLNYGYDFFEIGFRILTSIIKQFTNSFIVYFVILAFIPIYLIFITMKKYPVNEYLVFFMFYTTFYLSYIFNAMGQAIVMGIFIHCLKYFFKFNTFKLFFISLFSMLIHTSGIFIFISYIIYRFILKLNLRYWFWILLFLSFIFAKFHLIEYIANLFFPKYIYVYTVIWTDSASIFQITSKLIILLVLYYFFSKFRNNEFYKKLFILYFIGSLLFFSLSNYLTLSTRIYMFFRIVEILLFANIFFYLKDFISKSIILMIILLIYSFSFFKIITLDTYMYNFIF
jgi:hypothetical protein